jgi:hypothetical protein
MLNFFMKILSPDSRIIVTVATTVFVSWVIWASGSITTVSTAQGKLAIQQQALKESTDLKLDRMNDKLDMLLAQHGLMLADPKRPR